jgi:hypothetical protein
MMIWYFALAPVITAGQGPTTVWIATIGGPLGDVLLLASVASVLLRGAVTRFAAPVTLFAVGMTVYLAADVIWAANTAAGIFVRHNSGVLFATVVASLLMTAAPIVGLVASGRPSAPRTSRPPAWATHLPIAAVLVGCLLMLTVTTA